MRVLKQTRHGQMIFVPHDLYIGESLLNYGEFSPDETDDLCGLVEQNDVVLDIGSNIGCLTVPLARRAQTVYAFEPQRLPFQMLCANLALNNIGNVIAINAGAGAADFKMKIKPVTWLAGAVNSGGTELKSSISGEGVNVITVDSLKLDRCNLIKADVEGHELFVLQGAQRTITTKRPILFLEADRDAAYAKLHATLIYHGYAPFWHITPLFSDHNFDGNHHNLWPGIVSINLLCVPIEKPRPLITKSLPAAKPDEPFTLFRNRMQAGV